MVHQLLYASSVKREILRVDIESILFTARRYNIRNEITGILIASPSRFMQVLEGDAEKVRETYDRICRDDRHYASVILRETETAERQFSQWSMTSHYLAAGDFAAMADMIHAQVAQCDVITRAYLLGFTNQSLAA